MPLWGDQEVTGSNTGTIQIFANGLVTGTGTDFVNELAQGYYIRANSKEYNVINITNSTSLMVGSGSGSNTIQTVAAGNTFTVSSKPTYVSFADTSINAVDVVFVDLDESVVDTNAPKGFDKSGWVKVLNYTDANGNDRWKTEILVPMKRTGAYAGDPDDDPYVDDPNANSSNNQANSTFSYTTLNITPNYNSVYSWEPVTDVVLNPNPYNSQFRDLVYTDNNSIVAVGGAGFGAWTGTFDNNYQVVGGTGGNAASEHDIIVFKFAADTGNVLWSTIIGGTTGYDRAYSVENDDEFVYVSGRAGDVFYTTPNAYSNTFGGDNFPNNFYGPQDAVLLKVRTANGEIVASTYLSGPDGDLGRSVDFTSEGNVVAAIQRYNDTNSATPTTSAGIKILDNDLQELLHEWDINSDRHGSGGNPCVIVDRDNDDVIWFWMATDRAMGHTIPGTPHSNTLPSTAYKTGLLVKLSANAELLGATYMPVGTETVVETNLLTLTDSGNPVVIGQVGNTATIPVTNNAIEQNNTSGVTQAYLAIFDKDDLTLDYCTVIETGSSTTEFEPDGIKTGPDGRLLIGLRTDSTDAWNTTYPTQNNSSGGETAGYMVLAPFSDGSYWVEQSGYSEIFNFSASRGGGWNYETGDFATCGISEDNPSGNYGASIHTFERSETTPSFAKSSNTANSKFTSPETYAELGISDQMTIVFRNIQVPLNVNLTLFALTDNRWKVLIATNGNIFVWSDGASAGSNTAYISSANTYTIVASWDVGLGWARLYDNQIKIAEDSTGISNATPTDTVNLLGSVVSGLTSLESIEIYNVSTVDGSIPSSNNLVKKITGPARKVNLDPWYSGTDDFVDI